MPPLATTRPAILARGAGAALGFEYVRAFNPYDLYSKSPERPDFATLPPYYEDLVAEFFPRPLAW